MRRITRRGLFASGAVGTVAAVGYGRYAFGDEFEEHVADVLGMSVPRARDLTAHAKSRLGDLEYDRIASAFLFATTAPGRWVTPAGTRQQAVHAFLSEAVPDARGNLVLLGLRRGGESVVCGGLLRS